MIKKILEKIEIVLAVLALVLIIVIFLNPPTDFDGGPMMAYNFLFFFPMLLIAGLIAFISLIIAIKKVIKKQHSRKTYPIISIIVSSPVLLYFVLIATRIMFPTYDPELEAMLAEMDKPSEVYNNSIDITLESGKTVYLIGFNWGNDYKKKRVYISLSPYVKDEFQFTEAYDCQGDNNFDLFYKHSSDSIFVFISDKEPMYHYVNAKRIDEIPVRAIQLNKLKLDSLKKELEFNEIKSYEWN